MTYGAEASDLPPVTDWVNDWDWLDDQWGANAIDIWNSVREVCPMATTERYGRAHMPVTMEAISEIAHDTEHFSSIFVNVGRPDAPRRPAPPITSDPPDHHGHRRLAAAFVQPEEDRTDGRRHARVLSWPDRRPRRRRRTADAADGSTPSTSRSTGSVRSSVCPSPTPTCSATGSTATSSRRRATTPCAVQVAAEMGDYNRTDAREASCGAAGRHAHADRQRRDRR